MVSKSTDFRLFPTEIICIISSVSSDENCWKLSKRVENTVLKFRNYLVWAIPPLFSVFSKDLYWRNVCWLVVLGFNATLTAEVISWRSVTHNYVFPGFVTPVLTQLFFPKPPTTFLTCLCRSERRKYSGKKSRLNRGSNSQPPGHESDMLTSEPSGRDLKKCKNKGLFWNGLRFWTAL